MTEALAPTRAARILVVEDSRTQALKLRRTLEQQGYAVDWSTSAEAALESLADTVPDLVIADYHLPGMNGDGLVRQLRTSLRTRTVPVLMLTETRGRDHERQGLESGADAYVNKPAADDILLMRIRALLRRSPADRPGAEEAASEFRRATLLLVGPDRAGTAARFAAEGFLVVEVGAADAAAQARDPAREIDAVILLPGLGTQVLEVCRDLDRRRGGVDPADGALPDFLIVVIAEEAATPPVVAAAYAAGADEVVFAGGDGEVLGLRVRAIVRRKLLMDDNRRIDRQLRERQLALEHANAVAAAARAEAALAADLAIANARLRETQSQLVQAAKMSSLGELVAGIAHEINNPLAFILAHHGTVRQLVQDLSEPLDDGARRMRLDKAAARLAAMQTGLQRIQELVLNLRRFSRLDEGDFSQIDVPAAIDTVITLLSHKFGPGLTIERSHEGGRTLDCSAALLNQVVMNILSNAADAVGPQGRIRVDTRSDETSFTISIADNGPGIPPAMRDRIFEPFFTTKPVGAGTGLGLSISYGVVAAHKGTVSVDDAPGGGARFRIVIPRSSQR